MRTKVPVAAFLVVAAPLLMIGAWRIWSAPEAVDLAENNTKAIAERSADAVNRYLWHVTNMVLMIARTPDIRALVAKANSRPYNPVDVTKIDDEWKSHKAAPLSVKDVLENPVAQYLRDLVCAAGSRCAMLAPSSTEVNKGSPVGRRGIVREIGIADRFGRLVAASNVTSDYAQGDESWFTVTFDRADQCRLSAQPVCIVPGDAEIDDSAQSYGFELAVPVQTDDGQPSGVLNALIDLKELGKLLQAGMPPFVNIALVDVKGRIVIQDDSTDAGFAEGWIQEKLANTSGLPRERFPTTQISPAPDADPAIVALVSTEVELHPGWHVLVWQARHDALVPFSFHWWSMAVVATLLVVVVGGVVNLPSERRPAE